MDWTPYLTSLRADPRYAIGRDCFTPLDALDRRDRGKNGAGACFFRHPSVLEK